MDTLVQELHFDPSQLCGLSEKSGQPMPPAMALALAASFGSVERWREEFVAMGEARGDGSGWAVLSFQPREGTLANQWMADHTHPLAGAVPVLALGTHQHADRIDWAAVYARYQHAVHAASAAFAATPDHVRGAVLIDVRRAGVFEQADALIPGARWQDPTRVEEWAAELPADREVVVYCVYGHEVGRSTALRLRSQGVNARFLEGGIDGWQAAGRPLQPKGETP